jgi:hypothetical protein
VSHNRAAKANDARFAWFLIRVRTNSEIMSGSGGDVGYDYQADAAAYIAAHAVAGNHGVIFLLYHIRQKTVSSRARSLSLKPHAESPRAFAKCILSSFQNIAHRFANIGVFQTASDIRD